MFENISCSNTNIIMATNLRFSSSVSIKLHARHACVDWPAIFALFIFELLNFFKQRNACINVWGCEEILPICIF